MNKYIFDYSKLRGKIREKCGKEENFAEKIGIGKNTLSIKLNNISEFSQSQIMKSIEVLEIPKQDVHQYFFYRAV